jgi:hypothetical protein
MSFTRLLAAGQSIAGIKKQPGPYKMNPDSHLPQFTPVPKPVVAATTSAVCPVEQVAPAPEPAAVTPSPVQPVTETAVSAASETTATSKSAGRGFRAFFAHLLARFAQVGTGRRPTLPAKASSRARIRVELSLDQLKVVCNDLSDSDFEVLKVRKRPVNQSEQTKNTAKTQPLGMVWNRLSARLLRQAAQEFNLVQKERGKLCSQAGHGQASARDS